MLNVLRDGYSLPFMSLPQKPFFNNHGSVAEEQEFVCHEVAKLLASGAVTEVRREDLMVCNPLGVVKNSAHKPRLIVDLRYVNQHLRSCNTRTLGLLQTCFPKVTGSLSSITKAITTT